MSSSEVRGEQPLNLSVCTFFFFITWPYILFSSFHHWFFCSQRLSAFQRRYSFASASQGWNEKFSVTISWEKKGMEREKDNWEVWGGNEGKWKISLQKQWGSILMESAWHNWSHNVYIKLLLIVLVMMKYQFLFSIFFFPLIFLFVSFSEEEVVSQLLVIFPSFDLSLYKLLSLWLLLLFCFLPFPEVKLLLKASGFLHYSKQATSKNIVAKATSKHGKCTVLIPYIVFIWFLYLIRY